MGLMLPSFSQMSMLRKLNLSYCNLSDGSLLDDLGHLSSLLNLNLSGNKFINLATNSIAGLSKLCYLGLNHCRRLQSLPTLPPHLMFLSAWDCPSMEFALYSQKLCDLFALPRHHHQIRNNWRTLIIPGSEIPTWFENQTYCFEDVPPEFPARYDSLVSIIVNIPDHCRWSISWGIAVCLVLEYTSSPNLRTFYLLWTCRAPRPEADFPIAIGGIKIGKFNYPHLCIKFLWGDHRKIEEILIGDKNKLEFIFYVWSLGVKEDVKLKIRKCGWRLFWKDNVETCSNALTEPKCTIGNIEDGMDLNKITE